MDEAEQLDKLRDALVVDSSVEPDPRRVAELRARVESMRDTDSPAVAKVSRWVMAAAAAIVIVVAGVFALDRVTDSSTSDIAGGTVEFQGSIDGAGGSGELTVTKVETGRIVELQSDDLAILPKGEYYEVWFVGPDDGPEAPDRISAGTFHPDDQGRSDIVLTAAADPKLYPGIAVSAEVGDGNPGDLGPVVLTAEIAN